MKDQKFTSKQKAVLYALNGEHLTSFQLLKRIENISLVLKLYSVLDELRMMGVVNSYTRQNVKYHHAA